MRAIELQGPGGLDDLKLVERPMPKAGAGEVVVKLKAATLNYRDFALITGGRVPTPVVPLSDGCGEVVETGEGVTRVGVGDRVCPLFVQDWYAGSRVEQSGMQVLGSPLDGCAQEYLCLSEQGVSKVPDFLSDAEAASLPCAALTAWSALFVEAHAKPGDWILVQGTGGVSIFGLQFAKAAGCTVILTSSSDIKLERAKLLGADHLINYRADPDWGRTARKLTRGRGVDHVLDVGGKDTMPQSLRALRQGRHISIIGGLSGRAEMTVGLGFAAVSIGVGNRFGFEEMCRAIEDNSIQPVVDVHFSLEEIADALRHMEAGKHFGKIALDIST